MRRAMVSVHDKPAGILEELEGGHFTFTYLKNYDGPPVSLSMPSDKNFYEFNSFPPFFDGLLPEGFQLESLLRRHKIDRGDYFKQLVTVGKDLTGATTVEEIP